MDWDAHKIAFCGSSDSTDILAFIVLEQRSGPEAAAGKSVWVAGGSGSPPVTRVLCWWVALLLKGDFLFKVLGSNPKLV